MLMMVGIIDIRGFTGLGCEYSMKGVQAGAFKSQATPVPPITYYPNF